MDGRGTPLDRRYSFARQRGRQLWLSASFSALCAANLVDNLLFGGKSVYDTLLYTVSVCGILAAILGSVGVLFHSKELLSVYLVYILGTLAFCVLYHVFQLGTRGAVHDFVLLGVSVLMVILIWVQLFYSLFFLRLLTLYDVYHSHTKSEAEEVPTDDLGLLFLRLQQRPKWSQMVELLSMLGSGAETFTFDEFCQMESRLDSMERQARREARSRHQRQRGLSDGGDIRGSRGGRYSARGFQPSMGDINGGGSTFQEPLLREDRLRLNHGEHNPGPSPDLTAMSPHSENHAAASRTHGKSHPESTRRGHTGAVATSIATSVLNQGPSLGGGPGMVTFTVTAGDLEEAQRQIQREEAARVASQPASIPVLRLVVTADELGLPSQLP